MHKLLYILLLIPLSMRAQEPVKLIISTDYISLIHKDGATGQIGLTKDSTAKYLHVKGPFTYAGQVKAIRERKGELTLLPAKKTILSMGGNYTLAAVTRTVNALPSLQNEFVQGESVNGSPTWLGPETNEMFSYGPSIHDPKYDGSAYDNSIFRTGHMFSHYLTVQANIKRETYRPPLWSFSLKATTSNESTVIRDNTNSSHSFSTSVERNLQKISIAGGYNYFSSRFSNDNSNGFLNRVYQNSLLTPVSFNNEQGSSLSTGRQRSYSSGADNPLFLLKNNGHSADRVQQTGNFSLQKKQGLLTFGVVSALDAVNYNSNQSLMPGTAYFPAGLPYIRRQDDRNYSVIAFSTYNIRYTNYHYTSTVKLNYIYNNEKANISNIPAHASYDYHRTTNDASFIFNTAYLNGGFDAGLNAGNKFYKSTTSQKSSFFLPELSGFVRLTSLFNYSLDAKLAATYNSYYSEPSIHHTLSSFLLTQLSPQEAYKFMPSAEVQTFSNIPVMQHRELTSKVLLEYNHRVSLQADLSVRNTNGNVFPAYENNQLVLKNMADTRYRGFEVQLDLTGVPTPRKNFYLRNSVSFYTFSNTVTRVAAGYDSMAIAGFTTVHKALIKGQPLGVIVGDSSVIGDPTPDFTLKFSHIVNWRNFTINVDWEYRKGGDLWNGTEAVLNYYGRGAATLSDRNVSGPNKWVQYGYTGVAASYIRKGDNIRIHTLSLAYEIKLKAYLQKIRFTAYAENLLLWSAYKGADPNQLLYDQPGSGGLDFFNLPSTKSFGANVSIQF